jgi:hypothetical protein
LLDAIALVAASLAAAVVAFRLLRSVAHRLLVGLGLCRYHSPLLYSTGLGRRREIHLGTTRDFLVHGDACRRRLLARLAEGLLALCAEVECGRLAPDTVLSGTSDLLRDETAQRLGFRTSRPGPIAVACSITAWTQVSLLRTALRRGPALVRLRRLRRLRIRAGELAARRPQLERLRDRLVTGDVAA